MLPSRKSEPGIPVGLAAVSGRAVPPAPSLRCSGVGGAWAAGRRRRRAAKDAADLLSPLPGATVLLSQEVAASGVAFLLTVQSSMATPSHTASGVCLRPEFLLQA